MNQHLSPDVKTKKSKREKETYARRNIKKVCFVKQQYGNKTSKDDAEQAEALFGYTTVRICPFSFGFRDFCPLQNPKYTAAKYLAMARKCTLLTKDDWAKATNLVHDLHV